MCIKRAKKYLCGCLSPHRPELCRDALRRNEACDSIPTTDEHHKSHFPCYSCIRLEVLQEQQERLEAARAAQAETEARARAEAEERGVNGIWHSCNGHRARRGWAVNHWRGRGA